MKRIAVIITILHSILFAQFSTYILCEGNYGSLNASLWSIDQDFTGISGPLYWDQENNPLGDTGQNVKIHRDRLFIIMNNSNTIEIADLRNGFEYLTTIDLPNAGPRDLEIINNIAYVSCWYLGGIVVIDLDEYAIIDTLNLGALPEDLLYYNEHLYATITMNADWSAANRVIAFDVSYTTPQPCDTFTVVSGPEEMIGFQNYLYITSTYYDNDWNSYAGNSRIDLSTGEVITKDFGISYSFGRDITVLNDKIYRTYQNGICALTDSLTMDTSDHIGNYSTIYSMSSYDGYIFFGLSDYVAPDNIAITDLNGTEICNFQTGAFPGSFAFYDDNSLSCDDAGSPVCAEFQLSPNYPNPFNGSTLIPFRIHQPDNYRLSVFNVLGQEIAVLCDTRLRNGDYRILWDGSSQNGGQISSGIYFFILKSDRQKISQKMVFQR